jgi:translation initiation factor RLI1
MQYGAIHVGGFGCPATRSGQHHVEIDPEEIEEPWCRQCGLLFPRCPCKKCVEKSQSKNK